MYSSCIGLKKEKFGEGSLSRPGLRGVIIYSKPWVPEKFVCSFIMSAVLSFLLFKFQFAFEHGSIHKIFSLTIIVGISALIYFLLSILFKSFSIKDFKVKNYDTK